MSKLLTQTASAITKSSPLYEYWQSDQDDNDERKRLLMANNKSSAVFLFTQEPYKWENLYQSIVREIYRGDVNSIKGLKILLQTINNNEASKVKKNLINAEIVNNHMFDLIEKQNDNSINQKNNIFRFVRILFAIFTNPYGIELKRHKIHIYEKTGWIIYRIKYFIIDKIITKS